MHIAVDAVNVLHDRRGIGRYARALLQRWCSDPNLRITLLVPHAWPMLVRRRLAEALGQKNVEVRRRSEVTSLGPDLVWYPWNGMTWTSALPSAATIHDVWPFASPAEDLRRRRNEQIPFRTTADRAIVILTDSEFSKREIIKHLYVSPQKLHVVHLGVEPANAAPAGAMILDGASRYVLFVGESEARKDLATLAQAMAQLPDALRMTTGLVIAGKPGPKLFPRGRIDAARRDGKIALVLHFEPSDSVPTLVTGEVSDSTLQELYHGAVVFAFPSRYEGFGLPMLEAMAQGVPVIASDAASIPEVAGDAALYFSPGDSPALAAALSRAITDRALAAQLSTAGLARASSMTWDRSANETLKVFREALAQVKR